MHEDFVLVVEVDRDSLVGDGDRFVFEPTDKNQFRISDVETVNVLFCSVEVAAIGDDIDRAWPDL